MNYYEKVIAEGIATGRAEGIATGQRAALLKLLAAKFGALEPELVARVEAATSDDLERWLGRILVADRVEAVLDA